MSLNESIVEDAALTVRWTPLTRPLPQGEEIGRGPLLAPREPAAARDSFGEVVPARRLTHNLTDT